MIHANTLITMYEKMSHGLDSMDINNIVVVVLILESNNSLKCYKQIVRFNWQLYSLKWNLHDVWSKHLFCLGFVLCTIAQLPWVVLIASYSFYTQRNLAVVGVHTCCIIECVSILLFWLDTAKTLSPNEFGLKFDDGVCQQSLVILSDR